MAPVVAQFFFTTQTNKQTNKPRNKETNTNTQPHTHSHTHAPIVKEALGNGSSGGPVQWEATVLVACVNVRSPLKKQIHALLAAAA